MGIFDGTVTDVMFENDPNGNVVFSPWGIFGRGRVLSDPAKVDQVRKFVRHYYPVVSFTSIVLAISYAWLLLLVFSLLQSAYYLVRSRALLDGAPFNDEGLSRREAYVKSAASHSRSKLWLVFLLCASLVGSGLWMATKGESASLMILGAWAIALFGAYAAIIGYMLKVKPS
jgi:hypothetical protein